MGEVQTEKLAEKYNIYFPGTKEQEHLAFWQEISSQENLQLSIKSLKDLKNIPHNLISKTISSCDKKREAQNIEEWEKGVAPVSMLLTDVNTTLEEDTILLSTKQEAEASSLRASPGHAQNGHVTFRRQGTNGLFIPIIYANTTTADILNAIEQNPPKGLEYITRNGFQRQSQKSIDDKIYDMESYLKEVEENINHLHKVRKVRKVIRRGINPGKKRSPLENISFDMFEEIRGHALSTTMDDFEETRIPIFKKYETQIGGGTCYLMKTKNLKRHNLGIKNLSSMEYNGIFKILKYTTQETRIGVLEDLEIINKKQLPLEDIRAGEMTWDKIKQHPAITDLTKNPEYWGQFVRAAKGGGVSDDLMMFYSALLSPSIYKKGHQISKYALESRFFGARKGDKTDTEDKDAAKFFPGGQDGIANRHLGGLVWKLAQYEQVRDFWGLKKQPRGEYRLIDKGEEEDITLVGANRGRAMHSSDRYFLKDIDGTCATIEYLKHLHNYAKTHGMRMNINNIKDIIGDRLYKDASDVPLTCEEIPFHKIRTKMDEGAAILEKPEKREEILRQSIFAN